MSTIPDKPPFKFLDILYKKEFILFIVLVSILILNSNISPYFLDLYNLIDSTFLFSEKAIIALTMTFVIIARQIDLSVASIIVTIGTMSLFRGLAYTFLEASYYN